MIYKIVNENGEYTQPNSRKKPANSNTSSAQRENPAPEGGPQTLTFSLFSKFLYHSFVSAILKDWISRLFDKVFF